MGAADNGKGPGIDPAVARVVRDYGKLGRHLGASLVILSAMPLEHMLLANREMRPRVLLTLPAETTAEQAALVTARLDNDERLIRQAIRLVRLFEEVDGG